VGLHPVRGPGDFRGAVQASASVSTSCRSLGGSRALSMTRRQPQRAAGGSGGSSKSSASCQALSAKCMSRSPDRLVAVTARLWESALVSGACSRTPCSSHLHPRHELGQGQRGGPLAPTRAGPAAAPPRARSGAAPRPRRRRAATSRASSTARRGSRRCCCRRWVRPHSSPMVSMGVPSDSTVMASRLRTWRARSAMHCRVVRSRPRRRSCSCGCRGCRRGLPSPLASLRGWS
jgi:hypothetical protein